MIIKIHKNKYKFEDLLKKYYRTLKIIYLTKLYFYLLLFHCIINIINRRNEMAENNVNKIRRRKISSTNLKNTNNNKKIVNNTNNKKRN